MDIGTIITGLQAIGQLFGANRSPQLTPAMAEGEKPKRGQQPPIDIFIILPNQTPPMGISVPPAPPLMVPPYEWNRLPSTNMLRNPILNVPPTKKGFLRDIPHNAVDMPMYDVPPNMFFPTFRPDPSLRELYNLFYGTR